MPASNELELVFRQSHYRMVLPTCDCVLQIGNRAALLDDYLRTMNSREACFVSAHNPRSCRLPPALNQTRHAALEQLLLARQQRYRPGVGYGTVVMADWPPEPGFLVLNCGHELAVALGRLFGQYAVVFLQIGEPVQLLWCELR